MRGACVVFAMLVACGSGGPGDEPSPDGGDTPDAAPDTAAIVDNDQDGIDDALEQKLAEDYLPFVSLDPGDGCALDGYVVRVTKHPMDPTKIHIIYDHLYQKDCGLNGH